MFMKNVTTFILMVFLCSILVVGCGYPKTINLDSKSANGATVSDLTIQKATGGYKLTGKTDAPKDGEIKFEFKINTEKGKEKTTLAVSVPMGTGKAFTTEMKPKGRIKGAELKAMVYEPYEFTSKDYPMDPGLKMVYYSEKLATGSEQSQPFAVGFNLEGPWDFSTGPTEGEIVYDYVAPNETPQAADFPGANAARKNDSGTSVDTDYFLRDASSYQVAGYAIKTLLSEVSQIEKYSPPELTYKFPFKVGDNWESVNDIVESGLSTGTGRQEMQTKVIARNSVKVPQGEYDKCYLKRFSTSGSGEQIAASD